MRGRTRYGALSPRQPPDWAWRKDARARCGNTGPSLWPGATLPPDTSVRTDLTGSSSSTTDPPLPLNGAGRHTLIATLHDTPGLRLYSAGSRGRSELPEQRAPRTGSSPRHSSLCARHPQRLGIARTRQRDASLLARRYWQFATAPAGAQLNLSTSLPLDRDGPPGPGMPPCLFGFGTGEHRFSASWDRQTKSIAGDGTSLRSSPQTVAWRWTTAALPTLDF